MTAFSLEEGDSPAPPLFQFLMRDLGPCVEWFETGFYAAAL
jgi:hypothetical protein